MYTPLIINMMNLYVNFKRSVHKKSHRQIMYTTRVHGI